MPDPKGPFKVKSNILMIEWMRRAAKSGATVTVKPAVNGGAQAVDLGPEGLRPSREVRSHVRTVLILSY